MRQRTPSEIIQSLRATLRHIDENLAPDAEAPILVELKRIILLRIAELEGTKGASEVRLSAELPHTDR